MSDFSIFCLVAAFGITAVTAIDIFGSITSRQWNYNYYYLTPLSYLVYTSLGYLGSATGFFSAIFAGVLVGMYDATVGWNIAVMYKANWGKYDKIAATITLEKRMLTMLVTSIFFGVIGYFIGI